jgi:N-acetylglucosaminyl-diphospho-decaprenol L-rhamnosyltransferase
MLISYVSSRVDAGAQPQQTVEQLPHDHPDLPHAGHR